MKVQWFVFRKPGLSGETNTRQTVGSFMTEKDAKDWIKQQKAFSDRSFDYEIIKRTVE